MSSPATTPELPAAAPTTDRRVFLATLAAAGVMTGAALPAEALAAADHPDAELIEMAAMIRAAMDRADVADELATALRTAHVEPPLPEACYWQRPDFLHWAGFTFERDCRVDSSRRAYCGSTMDRFQEMVDGWKRSQNLTDPSDAARVRAREILEAHETWERDVQASEDAAGITAALNAMYRDNELANTLACRIPTIAARTPEGVAAKAFAIRTWWGRDRDGFARILRSRMDDPEADPWEAMAISMAIDAERVCAAKPYSASVAA